MSHWAVRFLCPGPLDTIAAAAPAGSDRVPYPLATGADPTQVSAAVEVIDEVARRQYVRLDAFGPRAVATAYSESAAAVLALELERDGLPIDRVRAEELIAAAAGPRPRNAGEAAAIRAARDERVLCHLPGRRADLRNPADVQALLAAAGVNVPSTRAWVLEPFRRSHPLVAALLDWRKDERIATTYGYRWLDEHVGPDNRLRGAWTACDGAAGRMTARNGLHNLPQPLRPAVAAEPGHVFVRADLGQIEPRVLAALSGDAAFAAASRADDLYAPVAATLGVPRSAAKIAVLAAMYGQRSGAAGAALRGLERAFPAAMALLDDAYAAGLAGNAADPQHQDDAIALARSRFGGLDYLVNNTGINPVYGPMLDVDPDIARKILDVNVVAAFSWVRKAVAAGLGSTEHPGSVVNIASIAGLRASGAIGWYGVSKAALVHLTMELGHQLGPAIRVNAVAPAVVKTQFAQALYAGREEAVAAAYPMKRLGVPEDIAGAVSFLLSRDAGWLTGQTLVVDGGVTLGGAL